MVVNLEKQTISMADKKKKFQCFTVVNTFFSQSIKLKGEKKRFVLQIKNLAKNVVRQAVVEQVEKGCLIKLYYI